MSLRNALKAIEGASSFLLTTHQSPDGDGIGSMYALHRGLQALGKDCVSLISEGIPEKLAFIDERGLISRANADPPGLGERLAIVLDTNDGMNLGFLGDGVLPRAKGVYFIDHHEAPPGYASEAWIDTGAAATAEMTLDILEALGVRLEADVATALYTGLVYDTGSFVYSKTTERSFKAAMTLVRAGASPAGVHARLHENSSAAALLLMKKAVSSLEILADGRIACMRLSKGDFLETGARYEDAEGLINIPLQVRMIEASILLKENSDSGLRCSLRSKGGVNVAAIAQHFGGGGHARAAGMKYAGTMDNAARELVSLIRTVLDGGSIPAPEPMRRPKTKPKDEPAR